MLENQSLRDFNSFGIEVFARYFVEIRSVEHLREVLLQALPRPYFILGGGSNVLFTKNFSGTILKNNILEKSIVETHPDYVILAAGAGENWHKLVCWCLERDLGGIENLSLIPGTVGAAPIQNIGAYGVELKDVFEKLEAVELRTGTLKTFDFDACQFGYRDSVFKGPLKGKYCITRVFLRLTAKDHHIHMEYGAIRDTLAAQNIEAPSIRQLGEAVIQIRRSKLPDPKMLGNAGSFFKNPEIATEKFANLQKEFPKMPYYPGTKGAIKVPAGWLIEQCGWKGKRVGHTGAHKDQALVLVNYGGATGSEIYALAGQIIRSVEKKFGITLSTEVNIL